MNQFFFFTVRETSIHTRTHEPVTLILKEAWLLFALCRQYVDA